jgi:GTPase SAR1 family protein
MNETYSNSFGAASFSSKEQNLLTSIPFPYFIDIVIQSHKSLVMKVILLGSSNVGKTSIINKYVKNVFYENSKPTIGVDFANK